MTKSKPPRRTPVAPRMFDQARDELFSQGIHCARMRCPDWRHLDKLPFDQFNARIFMQDARLAQFVEFLDGEAVAGDRWLEVFDVRACVHGMQAFVC